MSDLLIHSRGYCCHRYLAKACRQVKSFLARPGAPYPLFSPFLVLFASPRSLFTLYATGGSGTQPPGHDLFHTQIHRFSRYIDHASCPPPGSPSTVGSITYIRHIILGAPPTSIRTTRPNSHAEAQWVVDHAWTWSPLLTQIIP